MSNPDEILDPNKTSQFFYKSSKFLIIGGMPDYLKWRESGYTRPIYKYIQHFLTISVAIFIAMELTSFTTQRNLSEKQFGDLLIFCFSHVTVFSYNFIFEYHKETLRNLLNKLCIEIKNVYNDIEVERQMILKSTVYSVMFFMIMITAMISYGFHGIMQVLRGGTFVTVITVWPDVDDKSVLASITRVILYLTWFAWLIRFLAAFLLLVITTGCLGYQFKNLQSYFYSLSDMFDEVDASDAAHEHVERKYEEALKVGIQLHADTLWCADQCQQVTGLVYSMHIMLNVCLTAFCMLMMMSAERTLSSLLTMLLSSASLLTTTGIVMWNAGDVTVEAALVPDAMYSSGWQNCCGRNSQRVRKLLVVAMNQAQKSVVMQSFGMMEISYESYVSIVKACYSVFSFMY